MLLRMGPPTLERKSAPQHDRLPARAPGSGLQKGQAPLSKFRWKRRASPQKTPRRSLGAPARHPPYPHAAPPNAGGVGAFPRNISDAAKRPGPTPSSPLPPPEMTAITSKPALSAMARKKVTMPAAASVFGRGPLPIGNLLKYALETKWRYSGITGGGSGSRKASNPPYANHDAVIKNCATPFSLKKLFFLEIGTVADPARAKKPPASRTRPRIEMLYLEKAPWQQRSRPPPREGGGSQKRTPTQPRTHPLAAIPAVLRHLNL